MKRIEIFGIVALCAVLGSIAVKGSRAKGEVTVEVVSRPFFAKPYSGGDSTFIELSGDGRWATFVSSGNGLVTNDHNGFKLDVFLRDLEAGTTTLVSIGLGGTGANGDSYTSLISADGRYVVLESAADNLTEGDENEGADIFLYDQTSGELKNLTQGEDRGLSGQATLRTMSPDARFIVFGSDADDYAAGDTNEVGDLFLLDRADNSITLITKHFSGTGSATFAANSYPEGVEFGAVISGNGSKVAYRSIAVNLVAGLPSGLPPQLYLWDRRTEKNLRITGATNDTSKLEVTALTMSSNGVYLAFIEKDTLRSTPALLYLYDIPSGTLKLVAELGSSEVTEAVLTADGSALFYTLNDQIWLYNTAAGTRVLVSAGPEGEPGVGISGTPKVSADGKCAVFASIATNLVNTPFRVFQLFSFDRESGKVALLSRSADGTAGADRDVVYPVISADGRKAGFWSYASNLSTNGNGLVNDVFVVSTEGDEPVQLASQGDASLPASTVAGANFLKGSSLSIDGRFVVFRSDAPDLMAGDGNGAPDIFVRDLATGVTRLISRAVDGSERTGLVNPVGISADGRTVVYTAPENVGGANVESVLAYDTLSGTNRLANLSPTGTMVAARNVTMSQDGRYVSFVATADNAVHVRDLWASSTRRLGTIKGTEFAQISPGGRWVLAGTGEKTGTVVALFNAEDGSRQVLAPSYYSESPFSTDDKQLLLQVRRTANSGLYDQLYLFSTSTMASNLIATNVVQAAPIGYDGSAILYEQRRTGTNLVDTYIYETASNNATMLEFNGTSLGSYQGVASTPDGRYLALAVTNETEITELQYTDIYRYDRLLRRFVLVSQSGTGAQGDAPAGNPSISADGRTIVFASMSSNLAPNDRNHSKDVFVTRIAAVDENQNGLEDGWEQLNFGGVADPALDSDGDGLGNLEEYRAGTNPRDAQSYPVVRSGAVVENGMLRLQFPVTVGKAYQIQFRETLSSGEWVNIGAPQVGGGSGADLNQEVPVNAGQGFYRLLIDP